MAVKKTKPGGGFEGGFVKDHTFSLFCTPSPTHVLLCCYIKTKNEIEH